MKRFLQRQFPTIILILTGLLGSFQIAGAKKVTSLPVDLYDTAPSSALFNEFRENSSDEGLRLSKGEFTPVDLEVLFVEEEEESHFGRTLSQGDDNGPEGPVLISLDYQLLELNNNRPHFDGLCFLPYFRRHLLFEVFRN
ncbi:MAG: hypothetical protein LPK46_12030 [Bacteroidota bacterium]|nr:hypothetical protein [Bacteroidota bacterium]MDX5429228.1 hypothetical protein [Bacteroidota bacterium]MDX5506855.1 hypothetical protein [Bacteroidota bacterium]